MLVKRCCVKKCKSNSTREDRVTFHRFPKDLSVRDAWAQFTRYPSAIDLSTYVCSRHFLSTDFRIYQGTRYVLKSGAIPTIFPWTKRKMDELDSLTVTEDCRDKHDLPSSSKETEPENLEAIQDFIKKHDKPIQMFDKNDEPQNDSLEPDDSKMDLDESTTDSTIKNMNEQVSGVAATHVVIDDFILDGSESESARDDETNSQTTSPAQNEKGTSVALSVGSKVEARDFSDCWYSAEIVEVDCDEMEVLVRYESGTKKSEEWIRVNSTRLRPVSSEITSAVFVDKNTPVQQQKVDAPKVNDPKMKPSEVDSSANEEETAESKPRMTYAVGERCLARWRDNRRFAATIQNDLGNGSYEIIFDDGFQWKCTANRLSKLKDSSKVVSSCDSRSNTTLSPTPGAGPSTSGTSTLMPAFHTHLFDPTRDYLGSKSERREMKRKLNIKEIFNIGQKRRKETPVKGEKPKISKEKKPPPRSHQKKIKMEIKTEVKLEKKAIPDAIASIIGTVASDGENIEVKAEIKSENKEMKQEQSDLEPHENIEKGHITTLIKTVKSEVQLAEKEESLTEENRSEQNDSQYKTNVNEDEKLTTSEVEMKIKPDIIVTDEDTQSAKLSDTEFETFDHNVTDSDDQDAKLSDDQDGKMSIDPIPEEDKLQNFEKPDDVKHEQVLGRIKEAIIKLEDGLNRDLNADVRKVEVREEVKKQDAEKTVKLENIDSEIQNEKETNEVAPIIVKLKPPKKSKKTLKLKKKLKLLEQEKAVEIVKLNTELEQMKKQMHEIRMQVLLTQNKQAPETFLLKDEWCCKWVNGEPVGTVVEMEPDCRIDVINKVALPRKTVQVQDKRLPEGWMKLMVRRSVGHSAGKWDVVLVSPDKRRFHTKTDMRNYLENHPDPELKSYEHALLDFAVHLKLARRLGWVQGDSGYACRGLLNRPLKRKKLMLKRGEKERKVKKRKLGPLGLPFSKSKMDDISMPSTSDQSLMESSPTVSFDNSTLEDGYVYVGSLKVQVIDNLLRCPAEGCVKNFRNNTLLQMHIQHYHREMRKMLGATPKVLDLAYARTVPTEAETRPRHEVDNKVIKVKLPRLPKRSDDTKQQVKDFEQLGDMLPSPVEYEPERIPRSLDSPMMRQMMPNKPVKRPRVLLPVRRPEPIEQSPDPETMEDLPDYSYIDSPMEPRTPVPPLQVCDFESAISTHTVAKPIEIRRKPEKRKVFATISRAPLSEDEEMLGANSDMETRSSLAGSGTPDSKSMEPKACVPNLPMSSEFNEENTMYMYTETGERIKLERMKREEIINCHCGFREEDGLMVQCELCLCWQHALCHNIQREADVPQKYTCSICLNPRRGRRSRRFLHDQDRMNEGLLPGGRPSEPLRRSHDISGNLLLVADALQALRLKYYVATKKNHPKLYLWAKDWDAPDSSGASLRSERSYSELGGGAGGSGGGGAAGKENVPLRGEEAAVRAEMHTPTPEEQEDRFGQRDGSLSNSSLLGGLLSSPGAGGPSLEMPISTSELERLAKSVQEQEPCAVVQAPQPEAAIENSVCREKLLRHVQRCQAAIDARLDMLESEIIELEAQDPSFEDDETADYFPRTKQTVRMLLRDLDSMQQLGLIT